MLPPAPAGWDLNFKHHYSETFYSFFADDSVIIPDLSPAVSAAADHFRNAPASAASFHARKRN
jgi:hypothetical protein